jgi:hypothetical protein
LVTVRSILDQFPRSVTRLGLSDQFELRKSQACGWLMAFQDSVNAASPDQIVASLMTFPSTKCFGLECHLRMMYVDIVFEIIQVYENDIKHHSRVRVGVAILL